MKKRIFSIILCTCLIMVMLPVVAQAASSSVTISGTKLSKTGYYKTSDLNTNLTNPPAGQNSGYVHWDSSNAILTLYGATLNGGVDYSTHGKLTVTLAENSQNSITSTQGQGIKCSWSSLLITGKGSLNITGAEHGTFVRYVMRIGDNATVNITGLTGMGFYSYSSNSNEGLVIDAGTKVSLTGATYGAGGRTKYNRGVVIKSTDLTVKGGTAAFHNNPVFESGITGYASTNINGSNPELFNSANVANYKWFTSVKTDVKVTYTVTYQPGSNGSGSKTTATKEAGKQLTLNGKTFTRDGYEQIGWATTDGGAKAYDLSAVYSADANVTLYPVWKELPAGHTCTITPVAKKEASCTSPGKNAYYTCSTCGKSYEDDKGKTEIKNLEAWGIIKQLEHSFSNWQYDENNHWKVCSQTNCGTKQDGSQAAHKDGDSNGKCDTCSYELGAPVPEVSQPTESSKPADPISSESTDSSDSTESTESIHNSEPTDSSDSTTSEPNDNNATHNMNWLWIVLAIVIIAIAVVIFIALKKKKAN